MHDTYKQVRNRVIDSISREITKNREHANEYSEYSNVVMRMGSQNQGLIKALELIKKEMV